jgi:ArsR family transcriptional regulator
MKGENMEEIYTKNANIIKALSDPNRLKIIDILSCGEVCACTIREKLNITQPTLSHHMRKLEKLDIVHISKEGLWFHYTLNKKLVGDILSFIIKVTYNNENCICK